MIRTNIKRQKQSWRRGLFRVGDIFGIYVPQKGWLFGRIIRDDVYAGDNILVYIYGSIQPDPKPIPQLDKACLLIPPLITYDSWIGEYVVALEGRPLVTSDAYDKHCFQEGRHYWDEYSNRIEKPFEPCGDLGITTIRRLDDQVSEALGIPLIPEDQKDVPPKKSRRRSAATLSGQGAVTFYFPLDSEDDDGFDPDDLEDQLRKAVEKAKAGTWQGHGHDLAKGDFDTTFEGPNAAKLVDALRRGLRKLRDRLPEGWRATVRYGSGDEEPIDL